MGRISPWFVEQESTEGAQSCQSHKTSFRYQAFSLRSFLIIGPERIRAYLWVVRETWEIKGSQRERECTPVGDRFGAKVTGGESSFQATRRHTTSHVVERRSQPLLFECGNLLREHQVLNEKIVAGTTVGPDGVDGEGDWEGEPASHSAQSALLPRRHQACTDLGLPGGTVTQLPESMSGPLLTVDTRNSLILCKDKH